MLEELEEKMSEKLLPFLKSEVVKIAKKKNGF
jgi:hypothetical protein